MATLQELGLKPETLPQVDMSDLPDFGGFSAPPQPGSYRFRLPASIVGLFDKVVAKVDGKEVERVKLVFGNEHPLLIVQAADAQYINEPFLTNISGVERPRGKKDPVVVSELHYLLRALGETRSPASLNDLGAWLIERGNGGKEFNADITYSWVCSDRRDIYTKDALGANVKVEGTKGCGAKYYQGRDVQKGADGQYPYEITCGGCGASLRAFANLDRIRA